MQSRLLIDAIQKLSLARSIDEVARVVRTTARQLTGADGATFVLRDGDKCFYADEDAIAPLWKGMRFPLEMCISGWVMLNKQHTVIPDIYVDTRIPHDAYRPTFVKSLVMMPVRKASPIAAIGNYWARPHEPSADDIELLQALADSTSIALENVQVYSELERRVEDRTAQLRTALAELESFSYSVSHDLRAPLRSIRGFSEALDEDFGPTLPDEAKTYLLRIQASAGRMDELIEGLLELARVARSELARSQVDVSTIARSIIGTLGSDETTYIVADSLPAQADQRLVTSVLENLLGNAWKFTRKHASPTIEVGKDLSGAFFVRDNGAGFEPSHAHRLFKPFQRLHTTAEFPGSGIGLATVRRIIDKHGGRIWAEGMPGAGATFYFTLDGQVSDAKSLHTSNP